MAIEARPLGQLTRHSSLSNGQLWLAASYQYCLTRKPS